MDDHLSALLSAYWLRPETALWRYLDICAMKSFVFESPSVDLGCGDGVFSFIRAGGRFSEEFDVFQQIGDLASYEDAEDIYDYCDSKVEVSIVKKPDYQIDRGYDHKQSLLNKAASLKLHGTLDAGDVNKGLPYTDNSVASIFSNILYWLDSPQAVLKELYRVLIPGGKCCVMLPDKSFERYCLYPNMTDDLPEALRSLLTMLDRGRFASCLKQARTEREWMKMIKAAGFGILDHKSHLSERVIKIWDIGMRPIFPVLYKMSRSIELSQLMSIKKEWVDTLERLIRPVASLDEACIGQAGQAFHCFILQK